ncbi:MAG: presenilin family intramembrane aspartyl protease [Nanoarchaeota archaeon]|nr:presenilin family intramembrane aspartyl protease [Nanoarchaeota archaeon]
MMKHSASVTLILLALFLAAQFIGLAVVYNYIDTDRSAAEGKTVFKELPIGERPPLQETTSYISILLSILVGTILFLFLMKHNWIWIIRLWFLVAVVFSLTMVFGSVLSPITSFFLALLLGLWKLLRPNLWIQNGTEVLMYGGLAVIFVPVFNLFSGIILLILIALYDAYAVWKSKHMITLAKSQAKAKLFAGLFIPYQSSLTGKHLLPASKNSRVKKAALKVRTAILGGGDIGFPLIFAGIVLKEMGLWQSLLIPPFAALGLAVLLWNSQEKKFYPAMPFISAGCFIGLGIVWLLGIIV